MPRVRPRLARRDAKVSPGSASRRLTIEAMLSPSRASAAACSIRWVQPSRAVVQEVEYQTVKHKQNMATDKAAMTPGKLPAPVPCDGFVINADRGLLRHGHETGVIRSASGPDLPSGIAGAVPII